MIIEVVKIWVRVIRAFKKIQACTTRYKPAPQDTCLYQKIRACTKRYMPAPQHTCLHHNIHACTTRYMPAPQDTCLHLKIQAWTTRYMPAPQDTCLHHKIHACTTRYMPATQDADLHHKIHACTKFYSYSSVSTNIIISICVMVISFHCIKCLSFTKFPGLEILWKITVFADFQAIRPKLWGNFIFPFPQSFHTRKLGEISVFYAVFGTAIQFTREGNLFQDITNFLVNEVKLLL